MTSVPTESRPIRLHPHLADQVDAILEPYSGKDLEKAQTAIMKVYHSGASGSMAQLVELYREAVTEAVGA